MFELMNEYDITLKATIEDEEHQEGVTIHKSFIAYNQRDAIDSAIDYLIDYANKFYDDYIAYNIVSINIGSVFHDVVVNVTNIVNNI